MANNDGHNPQKQKLCGGVLSNFWEYKGVLIPKGLRITAFVILVVKIWDTSKLVGKHLLLWTCQMTLPTHSSGSSHISALKGYCVADRAPGPSASSSLASLVSWPCYPACSTFWISLLQRNQLHRPLNFYGDLRSMQTFSPHSDLFFLASSWNIYVCYLKEFPGSKSEIFFFKGRHKGSNSGLSCDSDPITLSCVTWAIDWISLKLNLLLYRVGWQYVPLRVVVSMEGDLYKWAAHRPGSDVSYYYINSPKWRTWALWLQR